MPTVLVAKVRSGSHLRKKRKKKKRIRRKKDAYSVHGLTFGDPMLCSRYMGSLPRALGELGTSDKPAC